MRKLSGIVLMLALLAGLTLATRAGETAPEQGREWAEAGKNFKTEAVLGKMPPGTRHLREFIPMRDGVRLATEIFLPPQTERAPAVLVRTPYGRQQAARYAPEYGGSGCAVIVQDTRGRGDSGGSIILANENEIDDGYDTIDWIARQEWSNGRVGITGGSGHGMAARMAFLAKHPALVVSAGGNTAGNTYFYWSFENGARRWLHNWCDSFRNRKKGALPTLPPEYDPQKWREILATAAQDNSTVLLLDDGWYNIFGDGGAIDDFVAFGGGCRVYASVSARAHGQSKFGLKFPNAPRPPRTDAPGFMEILKGAQPAAESFLDYYVLGDVNDAQAPGNCWRRTTVWPPQGSAPVRFYMQPDKALAAATPPTNAPGYEYVYDPRDPAPSLGGGYTYAGTTERDSSGAFDQRPLHERADVLRFYSQPLTEPLEIAGKLSAELFFSADVPDTALIVKIVDVYPDGYEMIIREGAALARFREGMDKPKPLEAGVPVRFSFEFGSAAVAFNRGHSIGVFVTSSSSPAYEAHPNVYEPVSDYSKAQVARIRLYADAAHPSCVILPVIQAE